MNTVPLELIALSCEYLSSEEILSIIDDYKLSPQENKYFINKKFINSKRYKQIKKKKIFKFPTDIELIQEKLSLEYLYVNPSAIHIIKNNFIKAEVDWGALSDNPAAIKLLEKNKEKIVWK